MKVMVSFNDTVDGDLYVSIKDYFYKKPEIEIYGRNLTNHFKRGTQELHDNALKLNDRLSNPDLVLVLLSQQYLNNAWLSNELSALLNLEAFRAEQGRLVLITLTTDIKFERHQTDLRSRVNHDIDFSRDRDIAIAALDQYISTVAIQKISGVKSIANAVKNPIDSREVRESTLPVATNIYLHGTHSRVNIHSQDGSTNSSHVREKVFADMRQVIQTRIQNEDERSQILNSLDEMEIAKDKDSFTQKYQNFIASAANHMSVLSPFIPALTQMLGG
jgi:hypothetical protein